MVTIKGYTNNPELRKKEVIPGTFDAVFKAVLTEEKEVLAEIIELVIGIPKEEVIKNGVIINSEYVRENIIETDKKSDLLISIGNNVINLEMDRRYYSGSNKKNNKYIHKIVNHYNPKNTVQICFTSYKEREEEKKQAEIEYAEEHGLNKGISQGIKQTAKNLLSMNMSFEDISKATGLSIEEINNLK